MLVSTVNFSCLDEMAKSTKQLAKELGLLRKRPLSLSSPRCLRKRQKNDQPFSHLIVIDFESTCWENDKLRPQEIIEFPAVLLNTQTGQLEDEFHFYVQPSEFPVLSSFCQQLTGISQNTVDEGIPLSMCLRKFAAWLSKLREKKGIVCVNDKSSTKGQSEAAIVTWSDWDLGVCLLYETKRKQITRSAAFNSWIDLRATYRKFYSRRPEGLNGALKELGIEFEGRQHSGLDDAKNTAKLAWRMICDGCIMSITKSLKTNSQGFIERKSIPPAHQGSARITPINHSNRSTLIDSTSKTKLHFVVSEVKLQKSTSASSHIAKSGLLKPAQLTERNTNTPGASKLNSVNETLTCKEAPVKDCNELFSKSKFCNKENIPPCANLSKNIELNADRSGCSYRLSPKTSKYNVPRNSSNATGTNGCITVRRSPRRTQQKSGCIVSKNSPTNPLAQNPHKNSQVISISEKSKGSSSISPNSSEGKGLKSYKPVDDDTPKSSRLFNPPKKQGLKIIPSNTCNTSPRSSSLQNSSKTVFSHLQNSRLQDITPPNSNNAKAVGACSNPPASKTSGAFKTPCQTFNQAGRTSTGPFKTPTMGTKQTTCTMRVTPPLCLCGRRSKRRQVQNCGPNMGRLFFSCSMGQSFSAPAKKGGCGFFQWESPASDGSSRRNVSMSTPRQFSFHTKSYIPVPCRSLGVRSK